MCCAVDNYSNHFPFFTKLLFASAKVKFHPVVRMESGFIIVKFEKSANLVFFEEEIILRCTSESDNTKQKVRIFPITKETPCAIKWAGSSSIWKQQKNITSDCWSCPSLNNALHNWIKPIVFKKLLYLAQNIVFLGLSKHRLEIHGYQIIPALKQWPINHSSSHNTVHGNMRNINFASYQEEFDIQGMKYIWGECGVADMCHMHCKAQGWGHIHLIYCPMNDNCTSHIYDDSQHEIRKYGPNEYMPKDELTHETYWKKMWFQDPCTE